MVRLEYKTLKYNSSVLKYERRKKVEKCGVYALSRTEERFNVILLILRVRCVMLIVMLFLLTFEYFLKEYNILIWNYFVN
jgi:hypothetical protein